MFIYLHIAMTIFLLTALHLHYNTKTEMLVHKIFGIVLWIVLVHNLSFYPAWLLSLERYYHLYYAAPFLLCYGPLLFFYFQASLHEKIPHKLFVVHVLPVAIAWIAFFIFALNPSINEKSRIYYYTVLYTCTGISLIVYAINIFLERLKTVNSAKNVYCAWYCVLFGIYIFLIVSQMLFRSFHYNQFSSENNKMVTTLFLLFGVLILFTEAFHRFKSKFQVDYKQSRVKVSVYQRNNTQNMQPSNAPLQTGSNDELQMLDSYFTSDAIQNMDLNLKIAASQLGITQKKLSGIILSLYGDSFTKLLTKKRIEYACRILLSTEFDETYEKLPQRCGFKSAASFYRNFRSLLRCSPSRFRQRYLETLNQEHTKKTK